MYDIEVYAISEDKNLRATKKLGGFAIF